MATIKFNTTVESKAKDTEIIPIVEGQFLIVTDTRTLMYDLASTRIKLGDVIELDTEAERAALITPLSKFYFVKNTGVLWRYNSGTWIKWDGAATQSHLNSLVSSGGAHGIRYTSANGLEVYNETTEQWESIGSSGGSTSVSCTLTANGWSNQVQTVSVSGLGATQNGIVSLDQNISSQALSAAIAGNLRVTGQAAGALTITADGTTPEVDIPIVVILLG